MSMLARAAAEYLRSTATRRLPPSGIKGLQARKLRRIVRFAYENVPYYHELIKTLNKGPEDFCDTDDLRSLPILSKSALVANAQFLMGNGIRPARQRASTGK